MHKTLLASLIAGAFLLPAAASAQTAPVTAAAPAPAPNPFTGNVMLTSEYLYRGISQSNGKPAIQGGFDYVNPNGLYVGTWGSSISWVADGNAGISAPLEIDVYGGYRNSFAGGDWNYDVGVLTYNYPGTYPSSFVKPDTTEIYGLIGWKWLSLKYSSVVSSNIFGFVTPTGGKTSGSGYLDLTGNYDLGNGLGLTAHVGHQTIKDYSAASYTDWKLGVSKDLGFGVLGFAYSDTNAKSCGNATPVYCNAFGRDLGKGRAVVSFSKTL